MANRMNELINFVEYNKSLHKMYNKLAELEIAGKMNSDEYNTIKDLLLDTSTLADQLIVDHYYDSDFIGNIFTLFHANDIRESEIAMEEMKNQPKEEVKDVETYNYNGDEIVIEDGDYSEDEDTDIDTDDMYKYFKYAEYSLYNRFNEHSFEIIHEETELHKDDDMIINSIYVGNEKYNLEKDRDTLEKKYGKGKIEQIQQDFEEYQNNESPFIREYYIRYLRYEALTYYAYLLEAIEKQNNEAIKNTLIKIKYNTISCLRPIEDVFIFDSDINEQLTEYAKKLLEIFIEDSTLYADYVRKNEYMIDELKASIAERNKDKYDDLGDIIDDILQNVFMRTLISCTPNIYDRNRFIKGIQDAEDVAKTNLDKKELRKSRKINENYTFQHERYQE